MFLKTSDFTSVGGHGPDGDLECLAALVVRDWPRTVQRSRLKKVVARL